MIIAAAIVAALFRSKSEYSVSRTLTPGGLFGQLLDQRKPARLEHFGTGGYSAEDASLAGGAHDAGDEFDELGVVA